MPPPPLAALVLMTVLLLAARPAEAQFDGPAGPFVQAGLGLGPGLGVQAGFANPALSVLTQEGVFYADYRFGEAEAQRLLVGLGVGGSVRILRILTVVADADPGPFELDAGLRFGPSFAFSFVEETAATQARQFRLLADPFVRGAVRLRGGRTAYAELGTQPGRIRGGLLLGLPGR